MQFQPDICCLDDNLNAERLQKCFSRAKVSSILTLGDSNGRRYLRAFFDTFNKTLQGQGQCEIIKGRVDKLTSKPDLSYFMTNLNSSLRNAVKLNNPTCSTCGGIITECQFSQYDAGKKYSISLEHIPIFNVIDETIQLLDELNNTIVSTTQEFILRYYLEGRYPDLLIIFLPFHHAKFNKVETVRSNIHLLRSLVHKYVPLTTKVFLIPTHGEFESTRTNTKYKHRKFHGFLANNLIYKLNHILFNVFKDDFIDDNNNICGFFDLWKMASTREKWSLDGIHMQTIWYESVVRMFLETFCNEFASEDL